MQRKGMDRRISHRFRPRTPTWRITGGGIHIFYSVNTNVIFIGFAGRGINAILAKFSKSDEKSQTPTRKNRKRRN